MKRLSLVFVLVAAFLANAHSENNFLTEGKTWNYELEEVNVWEDTRSVSPVSYVINGETTIDGKVYKRMMRTAKDETQYYCALREEGGKVLMHSGNSEEVLLYDFGVNVDEGYTLRAPGSEEVVAMLRLASKWQKNIHGISRTIMQFDDVVNESELYVIEGVGCLSGWNIFDRYTVLPSDGIYQVEHFKSCYDGESLLFSIDDALGMETEEIYKPFLSEGKTWKYLYHNFNGNEYEKSLVVRGDIVIGDRNYKKIVDVASGDCEFFIREEGEKVYCKYQNKDEYLLYDFGLNVGDTFSTSDIHATVVAVCTVTVNGRAFRALDVREDNSTQPNWWVKGVGSMNYLTNSFRLPGDSYTFLQCQLDEEVLFTQQDFSTLGVPSVTTDCHAAPSSLIYDLSGRRTNIQKGIYIQNGKKFAVK